MNITIRRNDKLPYRDLNIGDVFIHDGCVYMVTDQPEEDTKDNIKSVNLANGNMEIFGENVMVTSFENAEIILS